MVALFDEHTPEEPPQVNAQRVEDGWRLVLQARDPFLRQQWRDWLRLLPPMHAHCEGGTEWWVSAYGARRLLSGSHPLTALVGAGLART